MSTTSPDAFDLDPVADAQGPVDDEEDAGEHVAEGLLGGETQGDAGDAGPRQQGRDVHLPDVEDADEDQEQDQQGPEALDEVEHAVVHVVVGPGGEALERT